MPAISSFGGIVPRKPWHMLENSEATVAHNVKLRNGKIEPWRERKAVGMGVNDALTVYYKGCCALTWDTCVSVAEFVADYGRIFITGHADRPESVELENCEPKYRFLGVPQPQTAPQLSCTESVGRDCAARSYIYTYVNEYGEESAPSPVSRQVTVQDGGRVTVSGLAEPPAGYGIVGIRLYRSATGYRDPARQEQEMATDFLLVAELGLPAGYIDQLRDRDLGPVCNTRENRVPPEALRHISYMRGTGVLTGATTNSVHFSRAYQPHNWPAEYDMTFPYNIVNLVTVGNNVFISTDGYPYIIDGTPSCEARKCRPANDVDIPLPDIGCGYANSAIATPFGMVYSSKDGLVLVAPNATFQILTSKWFSTDDWVKIRPDTVRLAFWRGYLICVTDVVSFMLEIDGNTYSDFQLGSLSTISDSPVDMHVTSSGELMLLEHNQIIYHWNAGNQFRPYLWESRELSFGGMSSPTTAKVRTRGTTFRLLTPHPDLSYERFVSDEKPFRLGRLGRHLLYRVGFTGIEPVDFVELGMAELTVNRGQ